ncbi:hypothetical protein IWQ62_005932 [Dispira parvispora]|uniref:MFS transporter n=1 Tax=Dispira parvispora TaxID=1520584 RepID=A0A9W8E428_9FUNG|nr:hypothetical protein IWQ62_005932 [Dispira parvispora]
MSLVSFSVSGTYYTLQGIGGGGLRDSQVSSNANTALYICAVLGGLFAGSINNVLGPRFTCLIGSLTTLAYFSVLIVYQYIPNAGMVIFSGAVCGFGQALLSTVGGAVTSGYPSPAKRGNSASIYSGTFALSGIVGGSITFVLNLHRPSNEDISLSTFIAFLSLVFLGTLLTLLLMPPGTLIRDDGQPVDLGKARTLREELAGMWTLICCSRTWIVTPFFMMVSSYYAYQFNGFNLVLYTTRTRGANNVFYRLFGLLTAFLTGQWMDSCRWSKRRRIHILVGVMTILTMATWASAYIVQLIYRPTSPESNFIPLDVTTGAYWATWPIFCFWGSLDIAMVILSYWLVANLSRDSKESSNYAGYLSSSYFLTAALCWQLDAQQINNTVFLFLSWGLVVVGLISAFCTGFVIEESQSTPNPEQELTENLLNEKDDQHHTTP